MSIWFKAPDLEYVNALREGSMGGHLDITVTEIGDDFIRATMPVDERSIQPFGILHGGASVALAETLASIATLLTVDGEQFMAVGIEINANHLRPVKKGGEVTATARPAFIGRSTQVWHIELVDQRGRPVCTSRMTSRVVARRGR